MLYEVTLKINGDTETVHVPAERTLLRMLREDLGLTGTKNGCEEGECGACMVLFDGKPVNSCMMLAVEADGHEVVTIEGLTASGRAKSLQESFVAEAAAQCGFCTPGMIIVAYALLRENPEPNEEEIRTALGGNLCRCTGYNSIVRAIQKAAA